MKLNMKMNLENVNNVLLFVVIVMCIGLLFLVIRDCEKFQNTCNAAAVGVNNIHGCNGQNVGEVVKVGANKYMCGQTDGYGFPCL